MNKMRCLAGWLVIVGFSACSLGPSFEKNERDVESEAILGIDSGACDHVGVLTVESLYAAPYQLTDNLPPEGVKVAFDGKPQGSVLCTQLGCNFECCNNSCGYSPDCPFLLRAADGYNDLCLRNEGFACGGTDCSPWCEPFSTEPAHPYRFVGTLKYTGKLSATLDVETFCRL